MLPGKPWETLFRYMIASPSVTYYYLLYITPAALFFETRQVRPHWKQQERVKRWTPVDHVKAQKHASPSRQLASWKSEQPHLTWRLTMSPIFFQTPRSRRVFSRETAGNSSTAVGANPVGPRFVAQESGGHLHRGEAQAGCLAPHGVPLVGCRPRGRSPEKGPL